MSKGKIPSGDSEYSNPLKARHEEDEPLESGAESTEGEWMENMVSRPQSAGPGRQAHPGAKNAHSWGERSNPKGTGVMGRDLG